MSLQATDGWSVLTQLETIVQRSKLCADRVLAHKALVGMGHFALQKPFT